MTNSIKHFLLAAALMAVTPGYAQTLTKEQACLNRAIIETAPSLATMANKCPGNKYALTGAAAKTCKQLYRGWNIAVAREEQQCMNKRIDLDAAAALDEECGGPVMTIPEKCSPLIWYDSDYR